MRQLMVTAVAWFIARLKLVGDGVTVTMAATAGGNGSRQAARIAAMRARKQYRIR